MKLLHSYCRPFFCLLLWCILSMLSLSAIAADVIIGENGAPTYQIVIPDKAADEVVDRWLTATADLMKTALAHQHVPVEIVRESKKSPDKSGIYLGATEFAKKHGVNVETNDWTYVQKVVGKDIIIMGTDRKDTATRKGYDNAALLGSVKGALDFLHDYVGTRFVFFNSDSYASSSAFKEDGTVDFDPRSIAFIDMEQVAVPSTLDRRFTPPLKARPTHGGGVKENFYNIAMNFMPWLEVTGTLPSDVRWDKVISLEKYGETHPEYFALLPNGKRAPEQIKSPDPLKYTAQNNAHEVALDVTNPEVHKLMIEEVEKRIQAGARSILLFPLDSLLLSRCNCEQCIKLFGIPAETEQQVRDRGKTGKVWEMYFKITEPIRKKYPDVRFVIWDYQEHGVDAHVIQKFPENVIPQFQYYTEESWDRLKGIDIPAGISGLSETFTGFSTGGPFAPERTTRYAAAMAKGEVAHHVQWVVNDGGVGYVRGLNAPAYYVYGRLINEPDADFEKVEQEFYKAAFGEVAPQMNDFFDILHDQLDVYSDIIGLGSKGYGTIWNSSRRYDRLGYARQKGNKWVHQLVYSAEFIDRMEKKLSEAERLATDPHVKDRLKFIRLEWDYVANLSKIFMYEDMWKFHPTDDNFHILLDAVDAWLANLEKLAGGRGQHVMRPLDYWPQMRPFGGYFYKTASLEENGKWKDTSITWDTDALRKGVLDHSKPLIAKKTDAALTIDSEQWDQVPAEIAYIQRDKPYSYWDAIDVDVSNIPNVPNMPRNYSRTEVKTLYDNDYLYVRVKGASGRIGAKYIEHMQPPQTEGAVLEQEYAEVRIQPKENGPIYRFVGAPKEGKHFDSQIEDNRENVDWNGTWEYAFQTEGPDSKNPERPQRWTAFFKIPFSDLGESSSKAKTWKFNAGRNMRAENPWMGFDYLSWRDVDPSQADAKGLGVLTFKK